MRAIVRTQKTLTNLHQECNRPRAEAHPRAMRALNSKHCTSRILDTHPTIPPSWTRSLTDLTAISYNTDAVRLPLDAHASLVSDNPPPGTARLGHRGETPIRAQGTLT